jgi:hypothetical protein
VYPLLHSRAVSTLEDPLRGIHLMWIGPPQFLFAPGGWQVHRRIAGRFPSGPPTCDEVFSTSLARLRSRLELKLAIGWIRLSAGMWTGPEPGPCEIFTIELDRPSTGVNGNYRGRHGLAIGISGGKAVAYQFLPLATDGRNFNFGSQPVDQVIVYGLQAAALRCCIAAPLVWEGGKVIADLQLPLREFMPSLPDEAAEFNEAKNRLAPGESIDPARFKELADILRVALRGPGRRPIDSLLRMEGESEEPEEMFSLDPLRTLVASPKWRRVMGLGWLDRDPALVPGASYDYLIRGEFPLAERDARVFGFHTIPPGTAIPDDFSLEDCRFRLSTPTVVEIAPGIAPTGPLWTTRCGIRLQGRNHLPWLGFGIDSFSAVIDFPAPVTQVILELDSFHDLRYIAGDPGGPFVPDQPVPPGNNPLLQFSTPVTQLSLLGKGFLFAVRIPGDESGKTFVISSILPAVRFDETDRPPAPLDVKISNLQSLQGISNTIRKLHTLGFKVRWRPAPALNLPFWPADLQIPAPLDATMFEVERRLEPAGPYTPVLTGGDNAMFGSREEAVPDRTISPGADLMRVFPEQPEPQPAADEFTYTDVFSAPDEKNPSRRAPPPPGSVLRYRVRTLDVIGRPSLDWRESDTARLEKHEPPPVPAAYDPAPADAYTEPGPTGVYARILVRGAADLSPAETILLGTSDNAILLRWGWREPERTQDPFAQQFRVYLSSVFDVIPGTIIGVAAVAGTPGDWKLKVSVTHTLEANAAARLALNAGYPFFIVEHTAGPDVEMLVRTRIPDANGQFRKPALGPVQIPLKLSPRMTRPHSWSERFVFPSGHAYTPVTAAEQYEAVIRDRLLLSAEHPRDALWVGVTAADSESYVPDTFPNPGPDGPLPGNESPVVAVLCEARRSVRPQFSPPPPAGPVARILTPEPGRTAVQFSLDLTAFVAGLSTGELSQPERASVSDLYGALAVRNGQVMALVVNRRNAAEADQPLTLPNPADQAALQQAIEAGVNTALEDRLVIAVAARHPYADRLFQSVTPGAVPFGAFTETLPPVEEERFIYRYRRADAGQRLSAAAALVNAVVRVPSLAPGPSPRREPAEAGDPPATLRLRIAADSRVTHLLTFQSAAVASGALPGESEMLRVPNRPELQPGAAIRLRVPGGEVLPASAQPLGPLPSDPDGWSAAVAPAGTPGQQVLVWASSLTADGIPSPPGGPWRVTIPKAPLAPPVLTAAILPATIDFSWTLPDPLITSVWLEESTDDALWQPASPVLSRAATSWSIRRRPEPRSFRLIGRSQDGRRALSNPVQA